MEKRTETFTQGDRVKTNIGTIETVMHHTGNQVITYESKRANHWWHPSRLTLLTDKIGSCVNVQ